MKQGSLYLPQNCSVNQMIHKWKYFINLKALYQGNALFNKTFTYLKTLLRDSIAWSKKHRQKDVSGAASHSLPVKGMYPGHAHQPSKAWFLRGNLPDGCGGDTCKTPSAVTSTLVSIWEIQFHKRQAVWLQTTHFFPMTWHLLVGSVI